MIQAKDLRIGNWLNLIWESGRNVSRFVKVAGILPNSIMYPMDNQDGAYYPQSLKQFEPIPLTPENLKKAGFVKDISNCEGEREICSIQVANNTSLYYDRDSSEKCWYLSYEWNNNHFQNDFWGTPNYLHQLQNLYFALTGEELEISL